MAGEWCGILWMLTGPVILIGILCLVWRAHRILNHPEQCRRPKEREEKEPARQKE